MKIKTRLLVLAACSLVAIISIGALALSSIAQIAAPLNSFVEVLVPARMHMDNVRMLKGEIREAIAEAIVEEFNYSAEARQRLGELSKRYSDHWAEVAAERKQYDDVSQRRSPAALEKLTPIRKRFGDTWNAWEEDAAPAQGIIDKLAALPAGEMEEHKQLMKQLIIIFEKQQQTYIAQDVAFNALVDFETNRTQEIGKESETLVKRMTILQISVGILVIVLILGVSWGIFRAIMTPLTNARNTMDEIAHHNDLTRRVQTNSQDEIGDMVHSFNRLVEHLQNTLNNIRANVEGVLTTSASLYDAASQVAESSAQQSNATSAMAAAVEQMTVSVTTIANSTNDAQDMTREANSSAVQGGEIIRRTANEMSEISESVSEASHVIQRLGDDSQQISSVVQVIKEVADQTNLLALNAAIEAARAGEAGRGFAVVADEVRKLAERTAQSTGDISAMIGKIQVSSHEAVSRMQRVVEQVEAGKELAQKAGHCVTSIQEGADNVSHAVSEISNAMQEQNNASQDIARHVENIAQMTEENNAAAEETSRNAQHLDHLAQEAGNSIATFKL